MPLQLDAVQAAQVAALDAQLEIGLTSGAESPPATPVIQKLEGFDEPMVVNEQDKSAVFKPKIRDSFKIPFAALWKALQGWQAPVFQGAWVNYDTASFNAAGYYRGFFNRVYLRGLVKLGAVPSTIFTLPAGYRPTKTEIVTVSSNDLYGQVRIQPDGQVIVTVGSNAWVSLDNISFRVD